MDPNTLRACLSECLDNRPLIERSARAVYCHDADSDDWHDTSEEFKDIYRGEIELVLAAVRASLPELRVAA